MNYYIEQSGVDLKKYAGPVFILGQGPMLVAKEQGEPLSKCYADGKFQLHVDI